tara:strand:- start:283 stop:402 length:120 start_codon:yes stop_codon:yes gene_type:complete
MNVHNTHPVIIAREIKMVWRAANEIREIRVFMFRVAEGF